MLVENRYYIDLELVPRLWTGLDIELSQRLKEQAEKEYDHMFRVPYQDQSVLVKDYFVYEENVRSFLLDRFNDVVAYLCDLWNEESHRDRCNCWTTKDQMREICTKFKSGIIEYIICTINEHCRMRHSSHLK